MIFIQCYYKISVLLPFLQSVLLNWGITVKNKNYFYCKNRSVHEPLRVFFIFQIYHAYSPFLSSVDTPFGMLFQSAYK